MVVCAEEVAEVEAGASQALVTETEEGTGEETEEVVVEAEENKAGGAHRWEDLSHLLGRKGWKPQPHARSATQFNCNTTSMLAKLTFYASCHGIGTRAMIIQIV